MDKKKEPNKLDNSPAEKCQQYSLNIDSCQLMAELPSYLKPFGFTDEVNGRGAEAIPTFHATRHELLQIVKYWQKALLDSQYFAFLYNTIGSRDLRLRPFAYKRISRIAELVGEEAVTEAVREAESEFAKTVDSRAWHIFCNGTTAEREEFLDEVHGELDLSFQGGKKSGEEE